MNNRMHNPFAKGRLDISTLLNDHLSESEKDQIQRLLSDLFEQAIETANAQGLTVATEQKHTVTLNLCSDATMLNLHFPLLKRAFEDEKLVLKALQDNLVFHQDLNSLTTTKACQQSHRLSLKVKQRKENNDPN